MPQPKRRKSRLQLTARIADARQRSLKTSGIHRRSRRRGPDGQASPHQPRPVKPRTGVVFAPRRHIRMPDHVGRRNTPPCHDPRHQPLQRIHQRRRERRKPVIIQFNPNRTGVHIRDLPPLPCTRMPRPHVFIDELRYRAIPPDQIMRRNLAFRIAKPRARCLCTLHRSVMQHDQIRTRAITARSKIGGRSLDQLLIARRNGAGSQPQAKPSPSGSNARRSRFGPP